MQGHLSTEYTSTLSVYSPACLHAVFCALFPNVAIGNGIFYSLYLLLLPWSLLLLIRAARGEPWLALLAFCFLYNYSVTRGFSSFTIGIALSFLVVYCYIGLLTTPSPLRFALMAFLLILMFYAHSLLFLFVCAVLGACTLLLTKTSLKHRLLAASPLLLPGLLVVLWVLHSKAWNEQSSTPSFLWQYYAQDYLPELKTRITYLLTADNAALAAGDTGKRIALLWSLPVLALLPFVLNWMFRRSGSSTHTAPRLSTEATPEIEHTHGVTTARAVGLIFLLVAAGCFFILPDHIPDQYYLFERFSVFVLLALIWTGSYALPAWGRRPLRVLALSLALTSALLWGHYFGQFRAHAVALQHTLQSTPEVRGKSLAAIIDDSSYRGRPVLIHYQNYHALFNDGVVPSCAAQYRFSLITRRKDTDVPDYYEQVSRYSDLNYRTTLYGAMDFLLAHGSNVVTTLKDSGEFALCSEQHGWALLRRTGRKVQDIHLAPVEMHSRTGQRQAGDRRMARGATGLE